MNQVYISDLSKHVGKEVVVRGWLYNNRSSGKIQFMQIRDGSGIVQCVAGIKDIGEESFKACDKLPQESSISVTGVVREDKRAPGGYEITLNKVEIHHVSEPYPIALQAHGVGFLMEQRHLWLRSKKPAATLRVRAEVLSAIRDFFNTRGFVMVDAPILTPAACEGTSTLFEVDYFEDKAYLSQSGQLYMEAAAMALGKVYCFGPTFRAERSKTRKHLTEFWMVEPEIAYATIDDVMVLAEDIIAYIVERVLENRKEELKILERDTKPLEKIKKPFPRVSYNELMGLFDKWGHNFKKGDDLGAPEESAIGEKYDQPLLIHRFPMAVKAFYMKTDSQEPSNALCVDVIAPEGYGEIIGGSQREDDLDALVERIKHHKLPMSAFEWYLDLRRYGSVPHGGFGMGLERTVAWMCGSDHVRECIPFPRMMYKIYP